MINSMSFNQRANFATASRLLASTINEGIVNAIFRSNNNTLNDAFKTSDGMIFVLPNFEETNFNNENYIISVQTVHSPVLSSFTKQFDKVEFVDPWDMIFP